MTMAIKIKCLPEPDLQFGNGQRDVDPRRALSVNGPADHRGLRTIRLGLIGLKDDVNAALAWIDGLHTFKAARERNAHRFRDWPGSREVLGAKFKIEQQFVRMIGDAQFNRFFRGRIDGDDFEALVELF